MKILVTSIFIIISYLSLSAQTIETTSASVHKEDETKRDFKNQSAKEDYLATQFFKKKYKKQSFTKFKDIIVIADDQLFTYNSQTFKVLNTSSELKNIFRTGLFYPQIITGNSKSEPKTETQLKRMSPSQKLLYNLVKQDSLTISNVEEITFLNTKSQFKRFRFLLFYKGIANPTICFIELTNENVLPTTSLMSFIEGAKLTFFKSGWVVL